MNKESLFPEFPPVSSEEWSGLIAKDLKGSDPAKLQWKTKEGFTIPPFLREENSQPNAENSYRRGKSHSSNSWKNIEEISTPSLSDAAKHAKSALENGVDGLSFRSHLHKNQIAGVPLASPQDFESLFQDWSPQGKFLIWETAQCALPTLEMLHKVWGSASTQQQGAVSLDPLGILVVCGGFTNTESYVWKETADTIRFAQKNFPLYRSLQIQARVFPEAGSTLSQELGYTLAWGNEVLNQLKAQGLSAAEISQQIRFHFGVGSSFFPEIAKFRAARMLWSAILAGHGVTQISPDLVYIHATTSEWNMTVYDPYVNMLRGTTSSMSAILGGVDSLTTLPYQKGFGDPEDPLATRIARNTQHLLRYESYMDQVSDPAGGSYYIETLTDEIAKASWKIFQDVEKSGGFSKALLAGKIQSSIQESAQKTQENLALRREVLLGTTQYPNAKDKYPKTFDLPLVSVDANSYRVQKQNSSQAPSDLKSTPLPSWRAAEPFEKLRQSVESLPKVPTVFLLTFGNLAMRKARAGFVSNFLGVAGYQIQDNLGFANPEEALSAIQKSKPEMIVFCSSDEEVLPFAKEILPKIQAEFPKTLCFVAGMPKEKEIEDGLKSLGIADFLHIKSNLLGFLTDLGSKFKN